MSKLITDKEALLEAFPFSLSRDVYKEKLADDIAGELTNTIAQSESATIFPRIDEMPEEVLDILAADLKIQWYETDAPISNKRQAVKECMLVHKYKGTKYAVETALRSIYDRVKVKEWNEYGGEPFHFKVVIYDSSNDKEKRERVLQKVQYYKNIRSVLEETIYEIGISSDINISAAIRQCGRRKKIYCEVKNYAMG